MNALARHSDISTSSEAAAWIVPQLADCQLRFISALATLGQPATAVEVAHAADATHGGRETIRKRAAELLHAGVIRESGRRPCQITKATARTFVIAGWTCPTCTEHRSDEWLLGNSSADCPECESIRELTVERAAIAEYDGGLSREEAEVLALNELIHPRFTSKVDQ